MSTPSVFIIGKKMTDKHPKNDDRNVLDQYKNLSTVEIKKRLKYNSFPYAVLMEQWKGDYNIGTMIRNANAFGAREMFYLGKRRWDRRGSVGCHHYTDLHHIESYSDLTFLKKKYIFVGLDNIPGSVPMENFSWPENCLLLFGEEGPGLRPETIKMCDYLVSITQYGSVRSLNAGTASGIVMYDLTRKWNSSLLFKSKRMWHRLFKDRS